MHDVEWYACGRWWYQRVRDLETFLAVLRRVGITRYKVNGH